MEALTWLVARRGRGEGGAAEPLLQRYNCPGLASRGCGTSGTFPFSWQIISRHTLQAWIKLLKTWSVSSPPEALDPATPIAACNCKLPRVASRQQGMGVGRTITRRRASPLDVTTRARAAGGCWPRLMRL